jgi:hypothetical protein
LTVVEELLRDVRDLTTIRPHVPVAARFTRPDYRVYCEGYYMALVMALRVMDQTLVRRRLRQAFRRRAAQVVTPKPAIARARVLSFSRGSL